jgi:hypothetical protein
VTENLPTRRIDREALERIIRRAAELQAGELDAGDGLSEAELLKLGADVGIEGRFLRQALYEEQTGGARAESGLLARWIGPGHVRAARVVSGEKAALEEAIAQWMTEGEALTVKRRLPDATVWERQKGFFAEMKRGFGVGGRSYELAKAQDVTVAVTPLEPGYCHIEVSADLTHTRSAAATGGAIGTGTLGLVGLGALALGGPPALVMLVAAVPLGGAVLAPVLSTRGYRRRAARVQLALEQLLDRLEHGEIRPRHRTGARGGLEDLGALLFQKVNAEVRRSVGGGAERRRLPNP